MIRNETFGLVRVTPMILKERALISRNFGFATDDVSRQLMDRPMDRPGLCLYRPIYPGLLCIIYIAGLRLHDLMTFINTWKN